MSFLKEKEWIFLNEINHMVHATKDVNEMRKKLLELLGVLIPSDSSSFYLAKEGNDNKLLYKPVVINISQEDVKNYLEYGEKVDYTIPIFKHGRPIAYKETDLLDDSVRKKTVYYNDFLAHGHEYPASLCIAQNGVCYGAVTLFRSKNSGDFSDRDIFILNQLQNHLSTRLISEFERTSNYNSTAKLYELAYSWHLTAREMDVIKFVLAGLNNEEISNELFIGQSTVKKHLRNIYRKLDVKNRVQLIKLLL